MRLRFNLNIASAWEESQAEGPPFFWKYCNRICIVSGLVLAVDIQAKSIKFTIVISEMLLKCLPMSNIYY